VSTKRCKIKKLETLQQHYSANMRWFGLLLTLLTWLFISCKGIRRFSSSCKECTESPCTIKVGLLANLAESDEVAIEKAVSTINTDVTFQRNWRLQM